MSSRAELSFFLSDLDFVPSIFPFFRQYQLIYHEQVVAPGARTNQRHRRYFSCSAGYLPPLRGKHYTRTSNPAQREIPHFLLVQGM